MFGHAAVMSAMKTDEPKKTEPTKDETKKEEAKKEEAKVLEEDDEFEEFENDGDKPSSPGSSAYYFHFQKSGRVLSDDDLAGQRN